MTTKSCKIAAVAITVLLLVVIVIFMFLPVGKLPVPSFLLGPQSHVAAFFFVALPLFLVLPRNQLTVIVILLFAGSIVEVLQPLFGRGFSFADLLGNLVGLAIAWAAVKLTRYWYSSGHC